MITLPSLNWFCQRKNGRLVSNTYTGSCGTSPEKGILTTDDIYSPIFEYTVTVVLVNDCEQDSLFKAECSVKIYRQSGPEQISPTSAIQVVSVTEQNLSVIKQWLKDEVISYNMNYYSKRPNLATLYKAPEDIRMVDYFVRKLNECRWSEKHNDYKHTYFNMDILTEGIDRIIQEYNEWNNVPEQDLSRRFREITIEVLDLLRIAIQCYAHRITFLPADVNVSHNLCFVAENGCIRIPFDWYVGLKREFSSKIMQERKKRPFSSKEDFKKRMEIAFDEDADAVWGDTVGLPPVTAIRKRRE